MRASGGDLLDPRMVRNKFTPLMPDTNSTRVIESALGKQTFTALACANLPTSDEIASLHADSSDNQRHGPLARDRPFPILLFATPVFKTQGWPEALMYCLFRLRERVFRPWLESWSLPLQKSRTSRRRHAEYELSRRRKRETLRVRLQLQRTGLRRANRLTFRETACEDASTRLR
jgi:hypothetical protein